MLQNQEEISWQQVLTGLNGRGSIIDVVGLPESAVVFAAAQLYRLHRRPMLVLLSMPKTAERFAEALSLFVRDLQPQILYFPPYNILPSKFMSYHNETAARRVGTLYQMVESTLPPIVITTVGGVKQRLIPKSALTGFAELLMVGQETDRDGLVQKLISGGYTRSAIVEEPGDFSVRGGILDLFPPLQEDPLRIEFFGDTVESIRRFAADTQRTRGNLEELVVLPAREAVITPGELNALLGRTRARAAEQGLPVTQLREVVQRIKAEGIFPGIESLLPLIYPELGTLFDYLSAQTLTLLVDPGHLEATALEIDTHAAISLQQAKERQHLCVPPETLYLDWPQIQERLSAYASIAFKPFAARPVEPAGDKITPLICRTTVNDTADLRQALQIAATQERPLQPLADWLTEQKHNQLTALVVCRRPSHVPRLIEMIADYGIQANAIEALADMLEQPGRIYLTTGTISQGFVWPEASFALIADEEIFGTTYRPRKAADRPKPATELLNIADMAIGDLVVHAEHGIGRYEGLVKLGVERTYNDYLLIVYRDGDKLYLPVERMNLVQKYMGMEGQNPVLDKMGGLTWERVKDKVKRSTEKIAGELLKLYAERKVRHGHAFGSVDTYFRDFEDGFPFEETVDQHKAIEDVLHDMRQTTPMDRLVCGDVGYGKTEVALRAAFLAVSEAKQIAVLVPTTVLAEQHFATFKERFKRFPVRIASMSRFRSPKEQKEIAAELKEGRIDIVIGTHRLLQKDIEFKELGLLILDEEHRFGVRHKERIKAIRASVDVLTLTATPIPRTLHLSLLGIRDISLISTPPEQRRPVITYVTEFDDTLVVDAIRKEMARNGQIFFVHNNINSIDRMTAHLQKLVPEVRMAVGHGRMDEDELEKVMLDFMQRRIDLLVCTTIIESGLDVTAANTIFINRADHFGLAQIYQLRGRVGRGDEQAYAYLFIPNETTLTRDAQKRLKVLMEHSDLGSGFQIAMSDLKIRGGGTILGASQSGHIASVGYDMYLKLMESSIAELKGEPIQEALEPEINLPVSAFLPETYISDIDQRLSIYRRLARMGDLKEISALKAELEDRFGRLPDEAGNLLLKIMLKVLAVRAGCKRLDLTETQLQLQFSEVHQMKPFGIVALVALEKGRYRYTPDHLFKAALTAGSPKSLLAQVKNILIEIARSVN
ncbi:MAG: transcription-repair coupling factor [Desulfobacteraceae bacterium]|nr:transcription-repair coupling factor [Desulfobacteraceae bacterium]